MGKRFVLIKVKYRVDKRIKIAELTAGKKKFLVGLQDFMEESGIRDFEDESVGMVALNNEQYKTLWGDRIQ